MSPIRTTFAPLVSQILRNSSLPAPGIPVVTRIFMRFQIAYALAVRKNLWTLSCPELILFNYVTQEDVPGRGFPIASSANEPTSATSKPTFDQYLGHRPRPRHDL